MGTALGLGAVFTSALVAGAILHLDLPPARRSVERVVRSVLDGVFEGTVEVQGVERLGLDGAAIGLVVVHDPSGIEVLRARGVRAEASVPAIVRSLLGGGDIVLDLPFARVEQVDVRVEPNDRGQISIAAAFTPRAKAEPEAPGRPVRLSLAHVEIGHGYVLGKPDGTRPLDADVRHLKGSLKVEPGLVAVDVRPTGVVERRMLPGEIAGTAEYHLRVFGPKTPDDPAPEGSRMWATFAGQLGHVDAVARGYLEGDHVELTAHVPRARPEHVKALVPAYPVDDTVSADVSVRGELPRLTFAASARTERHGSAGAEGWVELGRPLRGEVTFHTEELDPSAVGPALPALRVTAKGKVRAEVGAFVSVRADVQTEPTSLEGHPIPATEATAVFDGFVWTGTVKAHEPGAQVQGSFATQKDGAVRFDATARSPSLGKVPRLRGKLGGAASVKASGLVREGRVDATVQGDVSGFRAPGGVRVARGAVRGRVHGPLDDLSVDAMVSASDTDLGGYAVQDALVRVTGPVTRPRVHARVVDQNDTLIDASAVVDAKSAAATRVKVRMERDGAVATGEIARIGTRGGGLRIDGVALDSPGLGKVEGSLGVVRGELVGTLKAQDLDLTAVRKLLGLSQSIGGKVDADISLAPVKGGRKGHARVSLRDGSLALVTGVAASVDATFDGDRVAGGGEVTITGTGERCGRTIARLRLANGDGQIQGQLLSGRTWKGVNGRVDIDADDWDLACLAAIVPIGLPVSEIHGQVAAKLSLVRQKGEILPSIRDLRARTYYLTVVGPEPAGDEPPWASRDIDVTVKGDVDGASGRTSLRLQLFDEALLASMALDTTLDTAALLDPKRRASSLEATPVAATFSVPRREIARFRTLPSPLRESLPSITGEAALDAYMTGSLARPSAVVRVFGWGVAPGPDPRGVESPWAVPVNVDAAAFYDGAVASLDAHVSRGKTEVLAAEAAIQAPIAKVMAGAEPATYFTARGSATFAALPLGDIPALGDRAIGGRLSGKIALDGFGQAPSLAVDLRADGLTLGPDLAFQEARVSVQTKRAKAAPDVTALAGVHLRDRTGGSLDATGYLQLDWRGAGMPRPRQDRPADLYARASRFRLAAAEPLLLGALREIDGYLDGDVRVGWARLDETDEGAVDADLRIDGGAFYLPQIGQKFRLVGDKPGPVRIVADRTGKVRVENLVAEGNSGRVRISAEAQLDGITFRSATGKVSIAERDALPVTLEGVELGEAWGHIDLAAQTRERTIAATFRSSDLHFKIPSATSRDVQDLEPHPDISISHQPLSSDAPTRASGRPIEIALDLRRAVIEGPGIYVSLSSVPGSLPTFVLTDKLRARGDIHIDGGTIEQMNRKFVADQGVVHFRDEVGNPYVNATAHWDAPDGSRVFVDYIGTINPPTRDKLRLRSNPPRAQQAILSLLLFGSETGAELTATSSEPTPTLGQAVGETAFDIGGQLAAQQFNALLSGITPLKGLSTRLGAGESGGLKGSLVYQVGDTVTALASYEGPGTGGSTSTSGTSGTAPTGSLTLDWRFYRNWLIRAKVGARDDQTSTDRFSGTVELLWQYRY